MSDRLSLDEAKARLDVAALWQVLKLPGQPAKSCRCPFHEDRSASFSVFTGRGGALRWKCHSGCGEGGPVELVALALDIDEREACRRLPELAGGVTYSLAERPARTASVAPLPTRQLVTPRDMHRGDRGELSALSLHRGLSVAGLALATTRGVLWFSRLRNAPAWVVTDRERVNAQARRMDGTPWGHIGGVKAWTLPGSRAAWPIGAREAEAFETVAILEGAPDLLAAHHFITAEGRETDVAAAAMLGASNHILEDALLLLAHKRVRLFPHADPAGRKAACRWTEQLERVGCVVDAFDFTGLVKADGWPVKDLNDLALIDADCFEAERGELTEVLPR